MIAKTKKEKKKERDEEEEDDEEEINRGSHFITTGDRRRKLDPYQMQSF